MQDTGAPSGAEVDIDRFESRRSVVHARNGIVATSQPLAAEAGVSVLRGGGNAFDAAVATAAALNVVEPPSTGIGGDAFALYRTADGDVGAMAASGVAPAAASIEAMREETGRETMPQSGAHAVTVPGALRGFEALLDEFGRGSLGEALRPAIDYATNGYPVSEVISNLWAYGHDRLANEGAREEYSIDGRAPRPGEVVTLPALGETLERIADRGADAFYEGDIADAIVETVRARGGLLSRADLAAYDAEFVDPVSTTYGGVEVFELPPANQGAIALEALNIADELGLREYAHDSVERVHYGVEAMKLAFEDGHRYIADPNHADVPQLHSKAHASQRASEITATATRDPTPGVPDASDTVLLTVADGDGNVVSFINSLFDAFGSGIAAGDTGVMLHSRGAAFSLDPDDPNRLEPRKTPFHTLIPGLARFGPDDWAAFGVMGAAMQPQGHLQVVSNLVDYDMSLQAAVDAPRWRYLANGEVTVESRMDAEIVSGLFRRGHDVRVLPPTVFEDAPVGHFGGGQIARNDGGVLSGGTDPRKDGTVSGY
ncbi:gamma-glutamyltransferase [Haloplanus halophilus]|uniref:gamma-glutamyltransferase n=1 Tax=Haloplanus halophilus TaxID=2949993 RepID=UPI00203EE704|nr:gamma-glutamyltransferase [Haloplanus sp. GDY1]